MSSRSVSSRFLALDLLRGFFIVVIIIDHLSRWPSLFEFMTGRALMWVTAAEGFVIISGLLIGYIRGFKAKASRLRDVAITLWRRALTLYLWAVIGSVLYTAAIWYIPLIGGAPGMPVETGQWGELIIRSVLLDHTFLWVYFLKLYAIFLAAAPLAIWLLRQNKGWLVVLISAALLGLGWLLGDEVLQWQFVFFVPVVVGYYIPSIQGWWQQTPAFKQRRLAYTIIAFTVVTVVLSAISTFHPQISSTLDRVATNAFAKDTMSVARAATAFIWFTGYFFIFLYLQKYIARWFGWLLYAIGTRSLTAYIVHGIAIIAVSFFIPPTENILVNTLLGAVAILIVWLIVRIPGINRVIPR